MTPGELRPRIPRDNAWSMAEHALLEELERRRKDCRPGVARDDMVYAYGRILGTKHALRVIRGLARAHPTQESYMLHCEGCGKVIDPCAPRAESWVRTADDCDLCPPCARELEADEGFPF